MSGTKTWPEQLRHPWPANQPGEVQDSGCKSLNFHPHPNDFENEGSAGSIDQEGNGVRPVEEATSEGDGI